MEGIATLLAAVEFRSARGLLGEGLLRATIEVAHGGAISALREESIRNIDAAKQKQRHHHGSSRVMA
ncbi:hypothetical protein [Sorangium sp. So ce233]|uniref:hypothetical protein n=1 Tax=Sorangium sp. So ce233 TaxID=3133290 RepID=UPI003F63AA96